jgi:hypothetical protein
MNFINEQKTTSISSTERSRHEKKQILIFLGAIIGGGVIDNLRYYAGNELRERVSVRANELETQFSLKWTNLRGASDELHALLDDMDISTTQLMDDEELQKTFLARRSIRLCARFVKTA